MTSPTVPYVSFSSLARQVWWYPVVRGLLAVALGAIVMSNPATTVIVLVRLFGIFVIIDGVVGIVDGIRRRGNPQGGAPWRITTGAFGVVLGAVLLFWPGATISVLAIVIGAWGVVAGILATISGLSVRRVPGSGWAWGTFWGIVTMAFGFVLIVNPAGSVSAVAWIIGLYAVLSGVLLVAAGFAIRSLGKKAAALGG